MGMREAFEDVSAHLRVLIEELARFHEDLEQRGMPAALPDTAPLEESLRQLQETYQEEKPAVSAADHECRLELEACNKELEAFAYSISHDLRAPLRSIDGFSQALQEDYSDKLDTQGQDYLRRVRTSAQRMAHMIDDLLRLSRLSRAEMHLEPVDLSAHATDIAEELHRHDPARQAEFQITPGITVTGDPQLLHTALEHLLGNAWKFTARNPAAHIELGSQVQDGETVYFVRDNGAGFDMAYAEKLFSPFQRFHAETDFPGSGIGLAIVQRIIRRHGGRMWAESAVDQGTTIYFTLGKSLDREQNHGTSHLVS